MTIHQIAPILVAVDGSPESLAALDWAVKHAEALGSKLRIITAYQPRNGPSNDSARSYLAELEDAEQLAAGRVRTALQETFGLEPGDYDHIVALGPIDRVLSDYSHHASVAVIGTRSQTNWIQRLFQKSVTNQLIGNLACPVISVASSHPASHSSKRQRQAMSL